VSLLLCLLLSIISIATTPRYAVADGIEAITAPSKDVTLAFVRPGLIAEVAVKEGSDVKANQVLVRQDDAAEKAQLEQLKAQAEDTIHIKAAEAQLAQKKVYLERVKWAAEHDAATATELEVAKLDVTIAELSLQLSQFEHAQDARKYEETKIQVERMQLKSPISGKVEKIFLQAGESADGLQKVIRVVKTDLLWIDVPVPLAQARGLKLEQTARVTFPGAEDKPADGTIIHIAAVADAASDTLTVRVEVPNPSGRPAGEHVKVSFPPVQKDNPPKAQGSTSNPPGQPVEGTLQLSETRSN
jgi:RND family efflux transporter MFP subunit